MYEGFTWWIRIPLLWDGLTSDDLLMLGVVSVRQELLGLLGGAARQQEAHANARGLPGDGAVGVEHVLDVLGDLLVLCAQGGEAWRGTRV